MSDRHANRSAFSPGAPSQARPGDRRELPPRARSAAGLTRAFTLTLLCVATGCLVICALGTLHWTLISDAVLMHYVLFLSHHDLRIYRDIVDVNLPGTYLVDAAVLQLFGSSALAWRFFDFSLLALAGASFAAIAWPHTRAGGLLAASAFAVLHIADGVAQAGQRDFQVAALLLGGTALLLLGWRRGSVRAALLGWLGWGVAFGAASTIKPQFLLFALLAPVATAGVRGGGGGSVGRSGSDGSRLRRRRSAGWALSCSRLCLWSTSTPEPPFSTARSR